jgi:hypothetical protein
MGFYFRKSVNVGPLRFNFSKSGIGVSTGIPGLRIGAGPRGHYVQAGRGAFYYRATLPTQAPPRHGSPLGPTPGGGTSPSGRRSPDQPSPADPTLDPAQEIESGSVLAMSDETSEGLLRELNDRRARWRIIPSVLVLGVLLLVAARTSVGDLAFAGLVVLVAVAAFAAWQADALRKTSVIMYDMDQDAIAEYELLVGAVKELGGAERLWHVGTRANVRDAKYHAGASSVISRKSTSVTTGLPSLVKCNVDVPAIAVGRQSLYFFPDRLLVFDSSSVGAVPYAALVLERDRTTFIEEEAVPRDSQVVGQTWRYVNKKGGPDRRFKDNRQLPLCQYEALHFSSSTGLNELLHASRVGVGEKLVHLLAARPVSSGVRARL